MAQNKIKIAFIAGSGRSGSTIIEHILGQTRGFFSAGEVCFVWERGSIENRLCGCGRNFEDCSFWQAVLLAAYHDQPMPDPMKMHTTYRRYARYQQIPLMLLPEGKRWLLARLKNYLSHTGKLYEAIREISECEIVIDSSKFPTYGRVLDWIPGIELYVVHLVRNPLAVTYSWKRNKQFQPGVPMIRFGVMGSSLQWLVYNLATELFWASSERYLRIYYEDFVENPQTVIRNILELMNAEEQQLPFIDNHTIYLASNHTISGNPSRFENGKVKIHDDDEWRSELRWFDRLGTILFTLPLFVRYGYPFRRRTCSIQQDDDEMMSSQ